MCHFHNVTVPLSMMFGKPDAWPTTSTLDCVSALSAAATREQPSSSRCCSTYEYTIIRFSRTAECICWLQVRSRGSSPPCPGAAAPAGVQWLGVQHESLRKFQTAESVSWVQVRSTPGMAQSVKDVRDA